MHQITYRIPKVFRGLYPGTPVGRRLGLRPPSRIGSEKVATQLLVTDQRDATALQTEPYDVMYVEFKATLHEQVRYRGTLQY